MNQLQSMLQDTPFVSYSYSYPHKSAYRPFDAARSIRTIWETENQNALSLYVHLPFCEYRCGFCNLFTLSNPQGDLADQYLQQLQIQAEQIRKQLPQARFSQLAIGGGTPTWLNRHELDQLFAILTSEMHYQPGAIPACIEASPATLTSEKVQLLKDFGIDRLSMGIQSFYEQETRNLGRPQKRKEIHQALDLIKNTGFSTLNLDLIYGADGQTVDSWLDSLQQALDYQPQELYLYPLYVRPLTGLGRKLKDWDDHRLTLYRAGRDFLLNQGYEQLSLRMFRAKHSNSQTDVQYQCQTDGMLGLGCGARSYTTEFHYSNEYAVGRSSVAAIIADFLDKEPQSFGFAEYGFQLDREEQQRRFVILSLLQTDGLSRQFYSDRFGADVLIHFPELKELPGHHLATITADSITLTSAGMERSDTIGPWLYSENVQQRTESFQCL
ncbi:Oxygen-independent coproporphyrinogen-III oxidase 1 [Gimesia alba]|uniref:Oxygen-independent coproporphyrinogen-III oxidase 1 n=1 Tax=Gimesia alba TaxID=2527973 RepID=A0A517R9U3_9PLAN|nr:STM4012 family radical SAM protein [Gimesia alba]QDT40543.1 Oxygen-independent coproporphyrinogen-III oxidase 1 [Gimesia alba]